MRAKRHTFIPEHGTRRIPRGYAAIILVAMVLGLLLMGAAQAGSENQAEWRLQIKEAAVVEGPQVLLGEIATPMGRLSPEVWREMGKIRLWPAPQKRLRPMTVSRSKLQGILPKFLGERAQLCLLPPSIAIQSGGALVDKQVISQEIVKTLTPMTKDLGGDPEFNEYRIPDYIFLRDPSNQISVDIANAILKPGRVPLRLREKARDGSVVRSFSGSVQMDLWKSVPVAATPLNRNDVISKDKVTYIRKNVATLHENIWDGAGGPWRMRTTAGKNEVLYKDSLEALPLVLKGHVVRLIYKGKHIRLEVPAEAMEDGGFSQTIPVRNMQTRVQVYARVLDADTVQVF